MLMSNRIGNTRHVVLSLDAYREGVRDPKQLRLKVEEADPQQSEYQTVGPDDLSSKWAKMVAFSTPPLARMGEDAAVTPGPYDLDMPRYERARARFFDDLDRFEDWKRIVSTLLVEHCVYMSGYEDLPEDDVEQLRQAHMRGEIRVSDFQFKEGVAESSYEGLLLDVVQLLSAEGFHSKSLEIARDSILMASDILQALVRRDVVQEAEKVKEAAIAFMYASDVSKDNAKIALSLNDLALRMPVIHDDIVGAEIAHTLMNFVGTERSALNSRAISLLSRGVSVFLRRA